MNLDILLYLILGLLLFIFVLIVPFLYQLWQTAKELTIAFRSLNEKLPSILENVDQITASMNEASQNVNDRISELSVAFRRIHALFNNVQSIQQVVRSQIRFPALRLVHNALPLFKGAQAFCRTLHADSKKSTIVNS